MITRRRLLGATALGGAWVVAGTLPASAAETTSVAEELSRFVADLADRGEFSGAVQLDHRRRSHLVRACPHAPPFHRRRPHRRGHHRQDPTGFGDRYGYGCADLTVAGHRVIYPDDGYSLAALFDVATMGPDGGGVQPIVRKPQELITGR
ncbi:twin-arginine translocation signal domain-containing protein [Streptomyces sp. 8K308]|uniref:twin-arginine translocation signal domain-containing protein n=1 Tax=Streptomyces sp. 8K308 TaxID=2530388 RepID=UPI001044EBB2|nr:twin-arginine translocation signal domain-containing protein [Streptomyces sp. 8K308]TDC27984.1 twin-arginine translocation signal domain-containing protein [Streptomyces sp. 8K308]